MTDASAKLPLLPCPFCGSSYIRSAPMVTIHGDVSGSRWWTGCGVATDHDAATFAETKEEAEGQWNTRMGDSHD